MEQFEEHTADPLIQFLETDLQGADEFSRHPADSEESNSIDDPVRVYLREMGSVSLLTRQGEIDLARRMERGKLRVRKALSRSPIVWERVLAAYEDVRKAKARVDEFVEV